MFQTDLKHSHVIAGDCRLPPTDRQWEPQPTPSAHTPLLLSPFRTAPPLPFPSFVEPRDLIAAWGGQAGKRMARVSIRVLYV
ncbi:hypothetical protein E2C01_070616 [Portunus trituberculatus]|uniref:Uncharacterized protein n=1 Tax=Portunus trituberculatus TaxID=210409 RepID=A0A5B7I2R7_PORTR|nr:hypothetical protein [Portunus trituberculatus]